MNAKFLILAFLAFAFLNAPASALISPEEQSSNPVIEQQAKDLFRQLRCLVCDNQTIDSSDSDMARQLRDTVRSLLEEGENPQEVLLFVHQNYGDKILYNPPLSAKTVFLWAFPFLFLIAGFLMIRRFYKS